MTARRSVSTSVTFTQFVTFALRANNHANPYDRPEVGLYDKFSVMKLLKCSLYPALFKVLMC